MSRIFLLSPADCGGLRARQLLSPTSAARVAADLRSPDGAPLGDLFSFVSGLYFRGKLTYARRFADPGDDPPDVAARGVLIITADAGLRAPDTRITADAFARFGGTRIDVDNAAYRAPLEASAKALRRGIADDTSVVLLGSVASPKYVDVLLDIFGERLAFPRDFVGRGDMSRGGLLLRAASEGVELAYVPVAGAIRHGQRPPKLPRITRKAERGTRN